MNEDFKKEIDDLIKGFPKDWKFNPSVEYVNECDEIECCWNQQSYTCHYVNSQISLMVGRETGEIVGVIISGIKNLLKETK